MTSCESCFWSPNSIGGSSPGYPWSTGSAALGEYRTCSCFLSTRNISPWWKSRKRMKTSDVKALIFMISPGSQGSKTNYCTSRPDFYGPFWVATTSVLFLAAGAAQRSPFNVSFSPEILGHVPFIHAISYHIMIQLIYHIIDIRYLCHNHKIPLSYSIHNLMTCNHGWWFDLLPFSLSSVILHPASPASPARQLVTLHGSWKWRLQLVNGDDI